MFKGSEVRSSNVSWMTKQKQKRWQNNSFFFQSVSVSGGERSQDLCLSYCLQMQSTSPYISSCCYYCCCWARSLTPSLSAAINGTASATLNCMQQSISDWKQRASLVFPSKSIHTSSPSALVQWWCRFEVGFQVQTHCLSLYFSSPSQSTAARAEHRTWSN